MLISYSRPSPINWLLNGTGASFLTDPARLANGRPAAATRLQFVSGTQTTSSVLKLRAAWDEFNVNDRIRFCGLVGTNLPVDLRVVCSMFTGFSWENTPVEGRVFQRADGVRVVWFRIPDEAFPGPGVQFSIFNDANGSPALAESEQFEIGEVWMGAAEEWRIRPTYKSDIADFSKLQVSAGGQPFRTQRRIAKASQLEFAPVAYDEAFGDSGLTKLRGRLAGFEACVVVPMTTRPFSGSAIEQEYINRHAEFGYAESVGPIVGEAPRFVFSAQFKAPPALLS